MSTWSTRNYNHILNVHCSLDFVVWPRLLKSRAKVDAEWIEYANSGKRSISSGQVEWLRERWQCCVRRGVWIAIYIARQSWFNERWRWCTALFCCCWFSRRCWLPLGQPRTAAHPDMFTAQCSDDASKVVRFPRFKYKCKVYRLKNIYNK